MRLTRTELREGRLTAEHLEIAVRTLREVGYVVFEEALPRRWIRAMKQACDALLDAHVAAQSARSKDWLQERRGHVGLHVPVAMPFFDPLALENPLAMPVVEAALGTDSYCNFYNTNTSWPGSAIQGIHRDMGHLFPGYPVPLPPAGLVVNIALTNFTLENGCTEVWPGTHLVTERTEQDTADLEARCALLPSVRTVMPAGSLIVRDLRMVHRGMPNNTSEIRTMLAVVYARDWIRMSASMKIPRSFHDALSERSRRLLRHNAIEDTA